MGHLDHEGKSSKLSSKNWGKTMENHRNRWFTGLPINKWWFSIVMMILYDILVGGAITILKNMISSMGRTIPYIMEHKIHVWNHQPGMVTSSKWTINIGNWRIGNHIPNYPGLPWAVVLSHHESRSCWEAIGIPHRSGKVYPVFQTGPMLW
jgi:hypothetical protein